jgi:cardiolipin synthase (CMP-forming)
MKHVPNILTIIRLLLIPVFSYFLWNEQLVTAGIIYIAAALTDVVDGYIARKYNAITTFGKLADPAADKLMQITAIVILYILGRLHVAFIIILVIKEALMVLGGVLLYKKNYVVQSNWFGKLAAVILNASIAASVVFSLSQWLVNLLIGISMAATLFALALYIKKYFRIKKELEDKA